ncbi:MAG: hypothetical protein AAF560_20735 [Acidobacteriota bacterium]
MADYTLQLTFEWPSAPQPGDQPQLTPALYHGTTLIPKPGVQQFQEGDTAAVEIFRKGDDGIPQEMTFVFSHADDCPQEGSKSSSNNPGSSDTPFSGALGNYAAWDLVQISGSNPPCWMVSGKNPQVSLVSKLGKAEEKWHFAVYISVEGPIDGETKSLTFCFDPELVVDGWG